MTWLLDTNACIRYLNGRSPKLRARFDATDPAEIRVCSVVKAELFFGAGLTKDPVATLANQRLFLARFPSLPFDDSAAEYYGKIRSELTRRGLIIGPNDLMIASICRASDATLVTHNTSEFRRVPGLRLTTGKRSAGRNLPRRRSLHTPDGAVANLLPTYPTVTPPPRSNRKFGRPTQESRSLLDDTGHALIGQLGTVTMATRSRAFDVEVAASLLPCRNFANDCVHLPGRLQGT